MRVTLATVSEHCKCSKSLISRVLNNDDTLKIPVETREKILSAVEELNYIPDQTARKLSQKHITSGDKKLRLGYITYTSIEKPGHPYFSHIIEGIMNEVQSNMNAVLSLTLAFKDLYDANVIKQLDSMDKIDGLILLGKIENDTIKKRIEGLADYIVSMDGTFNSKSDFVGSVYKKTVEIGLKHLAKIGYKDIGLLVSNEKDKNESCIKILFDLGIEPDYDFILDCKYDVKTAYETMQAILNEKKPPRAIFALNDEMAIGAMKALLEKGYKIPEDVALVGHDGINMTAYSQVPLTTVMIYKEEIGKFAVRVLLDRIKDKRKFPIRLEVPGELIIRDSCGYKKK